jgi:exodeoxyribonuclease VII large subunit
LGLVLVAAQRIDELVMTLVGALKTRIMRTQSRLDRIREQIQKIEPTRLIASRYIAISAYDSRNRVGILKILSKNQLKLAALENRLAALDPRSVLNRGYSITMNERTGGVVAEIDDVRVGDPLTTELAKGQIHSRVEQVRQDSEK